MSFTPVLAPMPRGILTTASAPVTPGIDTEAAVAVYRKAYADEPFVHVLDRRLARDRRDARLERGARSG